MSLIDPTESADSVDPGHWDEPLPTATTLTARRPGHAAMMYLLDQLGPHAMRAESPQLVPPALLSWHVGVIGEQLVGQELALLPDDWRVLHAVPAGSAGADIDHLVIGPAGVFVLNTKHHRDKTVRIGTHVVWIDGFQQAGYQRELLRRCAQVSQVLDGLLPAETRPRPLLVFVNAKRVTLFADQAVESVQSGQLVGYLLSLPRVVEADEVDAIARRAEQPSVWGASEAVLAETDPTMRFLALETRRPSPVEVRPLPGTASARAPRRAAITPQRGVTRLLKLGAALIATMLVLPAALAVVVTLLGLYFRMLTGS